MNTSEKLLIEYILAACEEVGSYLSNYRRNLKFISGILKYFPFEATLVKLPPKIDDAHVTRTETEIHIKVGNEMYEFAIEDILKFSATKFITRFEALYKTQLEEYLADITALKEKVDTDHKEYVALARNFEKINTKL